MLQLRSHLSGDGDVDLEQDLGADRVAPFGEAALPERRGTPASAWCHTPQKRVALLPVTPATARCHNLAYIGNCLFEGPASAGPHRGFRSLNADRRDPRHFPKEERMRCARRIAALVAFGFAAAAAAGGQVQVVAPFTLAQEACEPFPTGRPAAMSSLATVSADSWVERLEGEAALAHFYNLLSRRPGAFEGARRSLSRRGLAPTERVFVERTVRLARSESGNQILPAQNHSEENGDGEIVFWSWSDGNDNTWEGSIYYEVYATGVAATWEGQIDLSTEEYPWIWYERTWQRVGGPQQAHLSEPPRAGEAVLAAVNRSSGYPMGVVPAGGLEWARCWRKCVIAGCVTSAIGCIASNGGWPLCWASWCAGSEVGCAIICS